jgi:hypothetical protein
MRSLRYSAKACWRGAATAWLAASLLLPAGCSKSRAPEQDAGAKTNTAASNQTHANLVFASASGPALATSNTVTVVSTNDDQTAGSGAQEPAQRVAVLQGQYRAAREFDDRFEAALRLGEVGTAEAVSALE